jgi:23S rRNA pseudouridine1911/1915/1917 synthase
MEEPILIYEDNSVLVLDKPSGWVVNDANTSHGNPILQSWIKNNFNFELSGNDYRRSGIVHRLDKETSGAIIVAKDDHAFVNLQQQFKERLIKKEYLALVHGWVRDTNGIIVAPVGRLPWNREKFGVMPSGKPSETAYELVSVYLNALNNNFSLVRLLPKTGRTHQIRIHLKYIGHPIVSDSAYGGRKTSRSDRLWCNRLFLHAAKISFIHPESNKIINIESKIPDYLASVLKGLQVVDNKY